MAPQDNTELLGAGEAFVDLSGWWKVAVQGSDALGWLNDLISADISGLQVGHARRSILLSPTGHVRASFTVALTGAGFLLIQDPVQPRALRELLAPYVLSSDVDLIERSDELSLFAFPGRTELPDVAGVERSRPSCVGFGLDLLLPARDHHRTVAPVQEGFVKASDGDLEAWRVGAGVPRFGVDATEGDLPQEAGFEDAVSFEKGCYLGQEAMARVRNLGHPRRLIVHLEGWGSVGAGETVKVNGAEAGRVTSAAMRDGRSRALAQVAWDAREGPFEMSSGLEMSLVPVAVPGR